MLTRCRVCNALRLSAGKGPTVCGRCEREVAADVEQRKSQIRVALGRLRGGSVTAEADYAAAVSHVNALTEYERKALAKVRPEPSQILLWLQDFKDGRRRDLRVEGAPPGASATFEPVLTSEDAPVVLEAPVHPGSARSNLDPEADEVGWPEWNCLSDLLGDDPPFTDLSSFTASSPDPRLRKEKGAKRGDGTRPALVQSFAALASTERRSEPRRKGRLSVVVQPAEVEATVRDLSSGGVYLESVTLNVLGQPLRLSIQGETGSVEAVGIVRRIERRRDPASNTVREGLAVEFIDAPAELSELLASSVPSTPLN
jgi:hypothetical protein